MLAIAVDMWPSVNYTEIGGSTSHAGNGQGMLLTQSGSSWEATKAPPPANAIQVSSTAKGSIGPPYVDSIACPAQTSCVAVGGYATSQPEMAGLLLTGPA